MTFRSLFIAPLVLLFAQVSSAQSDFSCTSSGLQHLQRYLDGHPERVQQIDQATDQLEQYTQQFTEDQDRGGGQIVIPVVFHIIHNNGIENISDDQVKDAVRVLNNDYNKLNDDWDNVREEFLDIVADVGITFRLAGLDPDGNCTSGITRTVSELTNDGTQDMKDLIDWPRDRYLNIWVAASADGAAGYALYPGSVDQPWSEGADGIVILHSYVGTIGTSSVSHSRSLTHEVGHWINLRHCWGNSNDPGLPENCDMDDNVSDTPNSIGWTTCNLNGSSCGSALNNVENYMEYSYCSKMFTNGQKSRMLAALNSGTASRNNLWTANNLALTGTGDPQALCAAAFNADRTIVCAGESVTFNDQSYHDPTSWQWSLDGAQPNTSTDENPVVSYDTPGVYPVALSAGNGQNTVSADAPNYITVLPATGLPSPYSEDFEDMAALAPTEWVVNDLDGAHTWSLSDAAGYNSTKCLKMGGYGDPVGQIDELYSTTIDLSAEQSVVMSFRYAFARRSASNDDVLRVYVSNDCGHVWSLRKQLRGSALLPTVADQNATFTPNSADQWGYCEITNISSAYYVPGFRYKLWYQSDGGNNLWVDNINIANPNVGIEELSDPERLGLVVMPNPASEAAVVDVMLPKSGIARVEVLDATGRLVSTITETSAARGRHRWDIPVAGLMRGVYLVRVQQGDERRVTRFTKN